MKRSVYLFGTIVQLWSCTRVVLTSTRREKMKQIACVRHENVSLTLELGVEINSSPTENLLAFFQNVHPAEEDSRKNLEQKERFTQKWKFYKEDYVLIWNRNKQTKKTHNDYSPELEHPLQAFSWAASLKISALRVYNIFSNWFWISGSPQTWIMWTSCMEPS